MLWYISSIKNKEIRQNKKLQSASINKGKNCFMKLLFEIIYE